MSNYGDAALHAALACKNGNYADPVAAWKAAALVCVNTAEGQKKCCPKNTFLGLCQAGLVQGVPTGTYTRSVKNLGYAVRALQLLKAQPSLAADTTALWRAVTAEARTKSNGQMDVVIALWNAGMLVV